MICLQLELLPGCVVIEAGTGSGSLSHMIARCVGADGHLHTYEYNPQRAEQAAQEFADHGLHYVTCRHADVCADGWAYPGLAESSVDAVIFDLPQPWDAVPRVAPYVKQGALPFLAVHRADPEDEGHSPRERLHKAGGPRGARSHP